jgi:hypothetical protein
MYRCTDVLFLLAPVDQAPLCLSGDCIPSPYHMYIFKIQQTNLHIPFIGRVPQTTHLFIHPLICIVDLYWHCDITIVLNVQEVNPKFSGINLHIIIARDIQKIIIIISLLYRFSVTKAAVLVVNVSYEFPVSITGESM